MNINKCIRHLNELLRIIIDTYIHLTCKNSCTYQLQYKCLPLGNDQFFFSKSSLKIVRSVNSGPIPIVNLIVEDNLLKNISNVFRFGRSISPDYNDINYYSNSEELLFYSFLKIEFANEQLPQNQGSSIANLTTNNAFSCTTGNRTYFYFPVKFHPVNITGSVTINLYADIFDTVTGETRYANTGVFLTIDNGENNTNNIIYK